MGWVREQHVWAEGEQYVWAEGESSMCGLRERAECVG